jgi:hypothetical protein
VKNQIKKTQRIKMKNVKKDQKMVTQRMKIEIREDLKKNLKK